MSKKFLSPIRLAQGATNPATGSQGELFWNTTDLKVYIHNGTSWAASGGAFTMSPTAPTSPEPKHGDPWFDTSDGSLYVFYDDGQGATVTRTNLITNPSFEVGTTGWSRNNTLGATITSAPEEYVFGTKSLKFVTDGSNAGHGVGFYKSSGITVGVTYTISAYVKFTNGVNFVVQFYQSGVGGDVSQMFVGTGQWQRVSLTTVATATSGQLNITYDYNTIPNSFYVDGVLMEASPTLNTYFDGSSAGGAWAGTANASVSTQTTTVGTGQWVQIQTNSAINSELAIRAQALEADVSVLQAQTAGFEADVISLDARTDSLESRATAVESRAGALELGYNSPNYALNAAMDINQRSFTSSTNVTGVYTFDRWRVTLNGATVTSSAQPFSISDSLALSYGARNYLRIITSGQAATSNYARLTQAIENVQTLAGKTVTVSFWARAASGTPKVGINFENNYNTTSWLRGTAQTVTLNTAWTRYSVTMNVPSITGYSLDAPNTTSNLLEFWVSAGTEQATNSGNIGLQANTFDFWGVQVEANPVVTPFRRNSPNPQAELAACQRYYYRITGDAAGNAKQIGMGWTYSTTAGVCNMQLPVTMRKTPTTIDVSGNFRLNRADGQYEVTSLALVSNVSHETLAHISYSVTTGPAAGYIGRLIIQSATDYVGVGAEL